MGKKEKPETNAEPKGDSASKTGKLRTGRDKDNEYNGEVPIKRKRENYKPVVTYSQPELLDGLEDVVEEMPYDDYVQDLEVGVVYNNVDTRMGELQETEFFTLHRDAISLLVIVMCVGGIFMVFIGRAETAAFQSQPRLVAVEVLGYLFCIPILVWAMFWICPTRKEYAQRRKINQFKKVRLQPYNDSQISEVKESTKQSESKQLAKRREEYLKEERRIQQMKENKRKGLPTGREIDRFNL